MNSIIYIALISLLLCTRLSAQITGLVEDFNDNTVTGWEVPDDQTAGTFTLTETDSVLRIDYNRNVQSYEWDNFNYTPTQIVDATANPYITVRAKSDIRTVLTFKPTYQNGGNDWLQVTLPADNIWYTYKFELVGTEPYQINRMYMYLDGGSTQPASGTVWFDDMRIGDSVRTADVLDASELERLLAEATLLHDNSTEGTEEGQFPFGTKALLLAEINKAEGILDQVDLDNKMIDSTVWVLADACVNFEKSALATDPGLTDSKATKETKYLYTNLSEMAQSFLLFGMHDATGYGVGWSGDDDRSDVKDVCGSFPAIYSEDMNQVDRDYNLDRMRYRLTSAYNRGGVITICWHQYDPKGRSFYSSETGGENVVASLLTGGEYHQFYKERLTKIARFLKTLRGAQGESIPVIFRPYHEHTGGWFWWGVGQCSTTEYNQLWQFTVGFLRDSLNVHNLIYALSPTAGSINAQSDYYTVYPGDNYIDIFGMDDYFNADIGVTEYEEYKNDLHRVVLAAREKGKLAAITEVGQEAIPTSNLFTGYILDAVQTDSLNRYMSYAAVWRNQDTGHHFAPYPGHSSVPDFIKFYNDPYTLFQNNLPDMYQLAGLDNIPPEIIDYPDQVFTAFETSVKIQIKTNERAFLRYGYEDQTYDQMPHDFNTGQGGFDHVTTIAGNQGESYHLYIRGADFAGNMMTSSVEVVFDIDTLQRPVHWQELPYSTNEWQYGPAPFHFEDGTTEGTTVNYARTVYVRKEFDVFNLDSLFQMVAFVQYDNGFVLYVNGHEIRRINMPDGIVDYNSFAGTSTQSSTTLTLNSAILTLMQNGTNVIAAEIHQSAGDTTDFKFDLQLIDPAMVIAYGSEWHVYAAGKEPAIKTLGASSLNRLQSNQPRQLYLTQNYPNPFNPQTTIRFAIDKAGPVRLIIYDVSGRKVSILIDNHLPAGWHSINFDAGKLASGVYYYRLQTVNASQVRKMVLIR